MRADENATGTSSSELDSLISFQPRTKEDFTRFSTQIIEYIIKRHQDKPLYATFVEQHVKELAAPLKDVEVRKAASGLTTLANEKQKEQRSAGKKKPKAATKPAVGSMKAGGKYVYLRVFASREADLGIIDLIPACMMRRSMILEVMRMILCRLVLFILNGLVGMARPLMFVGRLVLAPSTSRSFLRSTLARSCPVLSPLQRHFRHCVPRSNALQNTPPKQAPPPPQPLSTEPTLAQQRKSDWAIIKRLLENVWPRGDWKTRGTVLFSFTLLVGSKVCVPRHRCMDCLADAAREISF